MSDNWNAIRRADLVRQISDSFVVVCVFSLRFIFGMNVLQPKLSASTRH